ncbi:MAG: endonuclease domain-containing protein [Actinomycetota bacterium]|nr:endonuclease domain-containing protein [Actinomycetota bacterium]
MTTPARTLIDIAALKTERQLEESLDDMLRRRLVSIPRLLWRIEVLGRNGRQGVARLAALVDARSGCPVPQSVLETRVAAIIQESDLPEPIRQYEVRVGGQIVAVIDFAYPDLKVAVEADGYKWHTGRGQWEHDLGRRNALTSLGWRVVHVTANDVEHRPKKAISSIKSALTRAAEGVVVSGVDARRLPF